MSTKKNSAGPLLWSIYDLQRKPSVAHAWAPSRSPLEASSQYLFAICGSMTYLPLGAAERLLRKTHVDHPRCRTCLKISAMTLSYHNIISFKPESTDMFRGVVVYGMRRRRKAAFADIDKALRIANVISARYEYGGEYDRGFGLLRGWLLGIKHLRPEKLSTVLQDGLREIDGEDFSSWKRHRKEILIVRAWLQAVSVALDNVLEQGIIQPEARTWLART